ncbi:hypothetical protein N752_05705 [Desulforamulus aquiferis]|nr:hypothetical protein [Desulforamulus aquiferis]RYD06143.1 hypothetical protein N752_05705 [Desulforamulus aquiferis]
MKSGIIIYPRQGRNNFPTPFMDLKKTYQLIKEIYLEDNKPLLVGYSGGKDSSATLQAIWFSLWQLPKEQLTKNIWVISSNTLVENPIVEKWQRQSLEAMQVAAREQRLPIRVKVLTPAIKDTFWVKVIGSGYAVPRRTFRWCTTRLKIRASNSFIKEIIRKMVRLS